MNGRVNLSGIIYLLNEVDLVGYKIPISGLSGLEIWLVDLVGYKHATVDFPLIFYLLFMKITERYITGMKVKENELLVVVSK